MNQNLINPSEMYLDLIDPEDMNMVDSSWVGVLAASWKYAKS